MRPAFLSRVVILCVTLAMPVGILLAPGERAEAQQQKGTPVWITEYGKKYHRITGCQYLWHSPRNYVVGLTYALKIGRDPCSRCRPPTIP